MNLHTYIAKQSARAFRYGSHDCVIFAGRWAEIVTGRKLLPAYKTKAEGEALLAEMPMLDRLRAEFTEVNRLSARIGDIAVYPSDTDLPALGLVCGETVAVFAGKQIGHARLSDAAHVFRVKP